MPAHDWTRVSADTFRGFHNQWLTRIADALNEGGMPGGYYVMQEADAGPYVPDLLAMRRGEAEDLPGASPVASAVALAPPKVADRRVYREEARDVYRRRHLAVRRDDGGRLVALIEVVFAANKDRAASVAQFAGKVVSAVRAGVHVLVVDLHPPTPRDPDGLPGEIGAEWGDEYRLNPATPLTAASYVADDPPVAYVQPFAVGDPVPDMPLFLDPGHYVNVPLGATYEENFARFPKPLRGPLEG